MKQYNGKTFLFSSGMLILLLVLVLMTSCAPTAKKNDSLNPIADAKSIGKALGCMFGGCKPVDQKKSQPTDK
jgi:prolyl-tRNA editing enzyme YbaK/EbsC (Cys-tRNA(Pro) deacylase)